MHSSLISVASPMHLVLIVKLRASPVSHSCVSGENVQGPLLAPHSFLGRDLVAHCTQPPSLPCSLPSASGGSPFSVPLFPSCPYQEGAGPGWQGAELTPAAPLEASGSQQLLCACCLSAASALSASTPGPISTFLTLFEAWEIKTTGGFKASTEQPPHCKGLGV